MWDERHGGKRKGRERGKGGGWRVAFWNVAGMYNKDRDFWEKLREWDVMVLLEVVGVRG